MVIFIILLILIATAIILIRFSTLKIDIKQFILINKKVEEFNVVISLNLFNKIKWLRIKLDNERVKKLRGSARLKAFNKILDTKVLRKYKNAKQILIKDWKHVIKNLNEFEIEKIKLISKIGTESPAITAISTGIISSILGIILTRKTLNPKFKVEPVYVNKNYLYLSINCIIKIKLVHIININKKLGKEVYQEYGRTSNRRTYANSNG